MTHIQAQRLHSLTHAQAQCVSGTWTSASIRRYARIADLLHRLWRAIYRTETAI